MNFGKFHFGYNATEDKGRRQAPQTVIRHESDILTPAKRVRLQATAQEQMRNHSLVAWMVRKHLDYVSKFHFSFRTGKEEIDTLVNRIFKWHGSPANIDFGERFGRDELFRLFELEKVLSGDAGLLKVEGIKLQAIESDLITQGTGAPATVNTDGLVVDPFGRVREYAICRRIANQSKPVFDHMEPKDNLIFDAYWTRFSSQFRGVSPLSVAINTVQDIHEGFEFNQLKMKMHAIFGVAFTRKDDSGDGSMGGASGATVETSGAAPAANGSTHDINPRSINLIDLNPGEDVKTIESGTPSSEFVEGSYLFIQIAMLALDIPITCFDSRRSSFSARIADQNEYEVSSDAKRTKNRYVRQAYSDWVLASIWNDTASPWPLRVIAARNGMTLRDVQEACEWVASGSPWLDKAAQVKGDELAISMMIDNTIDCARRRGQNVFENIDKQAIVLAYAKEKGVPMALITAGTRTADEIEQAVANGIVKANENGVNQ